MDGWILTLPKDAHATQAGMLGVVGQIALPFAPYKSFSIFPADSFSFIMPFFRLLTVVLLRAGSALSIRLVDL